MSAIESYCPPVARRQDFIPVHYVTGSHYEVGFSVVSIFCQFLRFLPKKYLLFFFAAIFLQKKTFFVLFVILL